MLCPGFAWCSRWLWFWTARSRRVWFLMALQRLRCMCFVSSWSLFPYGPVP
ncbi:hypothetical protein [Lysobacter gummosus]|uniref:hypothetical protein n=1 Tax=Lysobacter gummosus TaxID=262324 RepID=UPI003632EE77